MTNKKISALSSASTPLTGSEIVPINQSSVTDSVSVANLTAGRSVSASDYVMSTGNLVPSTAAKGINFTANTSAAGMTSKLLNDYEEGTWTPTLNADGTNFSSVSYDSNTGGKYIKVGKLIHVQGWLRTTSITKGSASGNLTIGGLPFTISNGSSSTNNGQSNGAIGYSGAFTTVQPTSITLQQNSTLIYLWTRTDNTSAPTTLVVANAGTSSGSNYVTFTATYVSA